MEVCLGLVLVEIIRSHRFPEQITKYLIKEASYQAVGGPFNDPIVISPLNSVPKKKDSNDRRVIVD